MAEQILMPKQGNSVESCIILEWRKKVGDAIAVGDIICEVETDKATIEVESTVGGMLLALLRKEGEDVPVMQPIAVVGQAGEKVDAAVFGGEPSGKEVPSVPQESSSSAVPSTSPTAPPVTTSSPVSSTPAPSAMSDQGASPRARNLASQFGVDVASLAPTGPKGMVIERDVASAVAGHEPVSPAALSTRQPGIPVPAAGSGIGGRVLVADLSIPVISLSGSSDASSPSSPASSLASVAASHEYPGPVEETPVKGIRKVTAKRMHESLQSTAQFTLNMYADATNLKALRARFKESDPSLGLQKITINDLVTFALVKTLPEFPALNAHWLGDKIATFRNIHLGIAADTPRGLLVPVLRNAHSYSLAGLSRAAKILVAAAQEGKSNPDDLTGGTFTISNIGAFGIESFTPVVNVPEVAILGVGGISLRPVEDPDDEENVLFVPHVSLSLTIDHQAVDGAQGSKFLKKLADNIAALDVLLAL
ncbi:dihydrolipoamide acetyltransferase family protein [Parasphaerochaeta coccoides]|uniref:Dihydrolipoamide acetyltransferase component of pyruvate dehydrogenase complex n=1 Tax=Parasphaerochaeta coccoides (strain ATCC BAA-1237 / DSM 17374 / SPN1) TaxID=760011 RepID=F4GKG8_PARC1|nr:dihydrolipoamide acetyltransferase family protein [Parasphaerochaeta coccoides]AEC02851.1 Dihydrolipoyllysine-residue acetyltransferase [Parasphaerochaeta coccoides DSM 17374]